MQGRIPSEMKVVLPKKLRALLYTASTANSAYIAHTAYTACMGFGAKSSSRGYTPID